MACVALALLVASCVLDFQQLVAGDEASSATTSATGGSSANGGNGAASSSTAVGGFGGVGGTSTACGGFGGDVGGSGGGAPAPIEILYRNGDSGMSSNDVRPHFKLANKTSSVIDL